MSCTHDVTLVLSTRVFVNAPCKTPFYVSNGPSKPLKFQRKAHFPEMQTAKFIWTSTSNVHLPLIYLIYQYWNFSQLILAFKGYEQEIKHYVLRNLPGVNDLKRISIRLSTAREANILEGLNLALSGYECYNVDRSFDRTGNACIVISPGFGVFDANRDMVSFTKQRVLDLGTMVHLVCLGPQPLHAVPLFVCRDFENPDSSVAYIVPYWINYSFFRSSREIYALNNSETVTRINVRFQEHLRERQHQRSKTITSMLSTTMPDNTRQRTASLNEELLSASTALVNTRPMEVGLSASELGSLGSISSTHEALEEPPWLRLYGHPALDSGCTNAHKKAPGTVNLPSFDVLLRLYRLDARNAVCRRNHSNVTDTLIHRKPQDLTHSYQSGSSYQPRGLSRLCRNAAAPVDFLACATASSWQPTGEGEVSRRQSHSVSAKNGSKKPVRLTSTETAVGEVFRTFPFGIHPQLFGARKTTSQRRWGHFRTAAHRMHLIKYDQTQCMRLLEGLRPKINLAKVGQPLRQVQTASQANAFRIPGRLTTKAHFSVHGRVSIPFSDLMLKFSSSATWRELCAAVDSPDIIQVCSQGNADIISPGEVKSLEKALASASSEFCAERMGSAAPSPVPHHRRQSTLLTNCLLREMLKPVGIDWKSLTTPALLPLTTDYFPEASSLLGEGYMIHEYRIVLITVSDKEWNLHFE
ncbi:unnamed protein product [Taenia asiatica]|uniref:Tudor domain-containing protein n=1 Tax=Taenia asiatica TaxID=60517 RepID=A0A158RA90_TAEAS|nr:unnamed protein product [Taenia asiatica]